MVIYNVPYNVPNPELYPSLPYPNPNIPTYKYVNVPKKTMKKTLITYLNPTYLRSFSPDPREWGESGYLFPAKKS